MRENSRQLSNWLFSTFSILFRFLNRFFHSIFSKGTLTDWELSSEISFLIPEHWISIVAGCRVDESWKEKIKEHVFFLTFLIPFSINFPQKSRYFFMEKSGRKWFRRFDLCLKKVAQFRNFLRFVSFLPRRITFPRNHAIESMIFLMMKNWRKLKCETHFGAGSPSASHSIVNGFSVSPAVATWKSISSPMGCLIILGGEWTVGWYEKIVRLIIISQHSEVENRRFVIPFILRYRTSIQNERKVNLIFSIWPPLTLLCCCQLTIHRKKSMINPEI